MGLLDLFKSRKVPEVKASAFGGMIASNAAGQAQWTQRDLQAYSRDGYQRNAVVYRCVRLIAENAASMPILVKVGETELEKHAALAALAKPNPFTTSRALLASAYSFRLLTGNAFLEAVTVGNRVVELHSHRPERVKVVPGADGYPAFYEYQAGGLTKRIPINAANGVSAILHLKDFNPLNDWYGQSALDPASWAIDGHTAGSQEVNTTLRRGGMLPGALLYDGEKELTDEQGNQAKAMFAENIAESRRSRLPLFLNKFWKWVQFGQGPKELGVTELKADAAREICFALGVPPMLLGIPGDNTYSNYAEANRAFWRETVIPFASTSLEEIGYWLGALTGEDGLKFVPNTDDIPALASERAETLNMFERVDFLTIDEKREAVGWDKIEGGDKVLVPSSMVPLEDAGASISGGPEPMDGEDPEDSADAQDDAEQVAQAAQKAAADLLEGIEKGLSNAR